MNYKEELQKVKDQISAAMAKIHEIEVGAVAQIMAQNAQNLHHGPTLGLTDKEKELLNEPLPLKERLHIGEWYKLGNVYAVYGGEKHHTYGYDISSGWFNRAQLAWHRPEWELVSQSEVQKLLTIEAKRRYKGKAVKFNADRYFSNLTDICSFTYVPSRNALCGTWGEHAIDLFCEGEWVDTVEKKTLPKIAGYEGRDMIGMLQWGCRCIEKEFLERIHSYGLTSLTLDVDGKAVAVSKEQMNQIFEYLNLESDE